MLELMLNNRILQLCDIPADMMLLEWLRCKQNLTGTKEGCASGDCGACTVVIADLDTSHALRYRQINACITPLNALHAKQIITVEHLKKTSHKEPEQLHPVQKIIADLHGTQCGFCTPGIVMSLFALSKQSIKPEKPESYLSGNLCRCTGYGPLIKAARQVAALPVIKEENEEELIRWMKSCAQQATPNYLKPKTRSELAMAVKQLPQARLIAGGTDLALEVTQNHKTLPELIDLSEVDDLLSICETENGWRIGAAVPVSQLHEFMRKHYSGTNELFARIGSLTIRNRATTGGSLGHASPIGDIAPLLMSLNGKIEVDDGENRTLYSPEEYITGYCKTRLTSNQWVSAVHLPRLADNQKYTIYKISKRYEDDISTLVLGINFEISEDNIITSASIAAGGVADKTVQLHQLELLATGQVFNQALTDKIKARIPDCIHPISDLRASAEYRCQVVQNLFQRFYFECHQTPVRLTNETQQN